MVSTSKNSAKFMQNASLKFSIATLESFLKYAVIRRSLQNSLSICNRLLAANSFVRFSLISRAVL
jgi:hypothetical protein